jgi:hypothetical protein
LNDVVVIAYDHIRVYPRAPQSIFRSITSM